MEEFRMGRNSIEDRLQEIEKR
ncbi:hypothetical protein LCGC14_1934130, partial [marine sediment metagenome]